MFYNGLLLVVGLLAAYHLRNNLEARILTSWIGLLWLLTGIHLIEGFDKVPILSLLSYTLYSMSIHAFHIPLAALVALWLSPTTNLRIEGGGNRILTYGWDPHLNHRVVFTIIVVIMLTCFSGLAMMIEMSQHAELRTLSNSAIQHIAS